MTETCNFYTECEYPVMKMSSASGGYSLALRARHKARRYAARSPRLPNHPFKKFPPPPLYNPSWPRQ